MKEYTKKTMNILMIFVILLLFAGIVSASENVTEDEIGVSSSDIEMIDADDTGSFTELQNIINNAKKGDTINLDKNYSYTNGDSKDGIVINKSIMINGNGAVLDGKDSSRIFKVNEAYDDSYYGDYDETNWNGVLLKNLVFINGNSKNGGAVFAGDEDDENAVAIPLNITNCEFKNNYAIGVQVNSYEKSSTGYGGAIYSTGIVDIKDSKFIENKASEEGGAIFGGKLSEINVLNSNFTKNKASFGGAIYSPSLSVKNSNFNNNTASSYGGAINSEYDCNLKIVKSVFKFNHGGVGAGAIIFSGYAKISESEFINNTGKSDGGAIYTDGYNLNLNIIKSLFINNSAEKGGAIDFDLDVYNSKGNIKDTIFKSNLAGSGGAISNLPKNLKLTNNTFQDNNNDEVFINFKTFKTYYKSGKVFKVTVINQITKKPVANAKVALILMHSASSRNSASKTLYATTNSKGVASFKTISKIEPNYYDWGYEMEVKGYGTAYMELYVISVNIPTITKAPKVVAKLKASKQFKVTVKNKMNKKAVKNCKVKVNVYTGKKYKTYTIKTDKKGVAKLNTKNLKKGTHKVEISSGNYKYTINAKSTIIIK